MAWLGAARPALAAEGQAAKPKGKGGYRESARFTQHTGPVVAVALSTDGRSIATVGEDRAIHIVDGRTWKSIRKRTVSAAVRDLTFTRAGDVLVAGGKDPKLGACVYLWQPRGDRVAAVWNPTETGVVAIALAPNESHLAMVHGDGTTGIWLLAAGGEKAALYTIESPLAHSRRVTVDFSSDGKAVLTGGIDGRTRQYRMPTRPTAKPKVYSVGGRATPAVSSVRYSPVGKTLATGHADGSVRLWNDQSGQLIWHCIAEGGAVRVVAYTPDGRYVASGGEDKLIRVWDVATGQLMWEIGGHTEAINDLLAPTSDSLVSASADGSVRYWRRADARATAEATSGVTIPRVSRKKPPRKAELAVPPAKDLTMATKLIKDVFKEDWEKATEPAAQRGLATKLLEQGRQEENSEAERYAALSAARTLAIDAAAVQLAIDIADEIGVWFKTDPTKLLADTVERLGKTCRSPEERTKLCAIALTLVEDAAAEDRYDVVTRLLTVADLAAKGARKIDLQRAVRTVENQVEGSKGQWEAYQAALKTLAENSTDPSANLAAGKYLCFVRGQWDKGLAHLARGSDARLKDAASKEVAGVETADEWIELGDLWLAAAEGAGPADRPSCNAAADFWYRKALEELTGLKKLKVQKELEKLDPVPSHLQRRE